MTEKQWQDDIEMTLRSFFTCYESGDNNDWFYMVRNDDIDSVSRSLACYIVGRIKLETKDKLKYVR